MLRRQLALWTIFTPHLHRVPTCTVCDAEDVTVSSSLVAEESKRNLLDLVTNTQFQKNSSHTGIICSDGTVESMRRKGIQQWLSLPLHNSDNSCSSDKYRVAWNRFNDRRQLLTTEDIEDACSYLDSFAVRSSHKARSSDGSVTIPNFLSVPSPGNTTPAAPFEGINIFRSHVEQCGVHDVEKQLRFQVTLLAFEQAAKRANVPFFLACGTALGAVREGYFIEHDEDIDIGIFSQDVSDGRLDYDMPNKLQLLLHEATVSFDFIIFEVCGVLDKGLEVRLFHSGTQVRLDLNIYYAPLPEDAALVASSGPFVWTSTYYEDAAARRHGMYRYQHTPFSHDLRKVAFCQMCPKSAVSFHIPPEAYFVEYFGSDWRTPKKHSYAEGVRGGYYKNIIDE